MSWQKIWGPTELVVVDGENGTVYAKPFSLPPTAGGLAKVADIHRWDGQPDAWTPLGMPAKK